MLTHSFCQSDNGYFAKTAEVGSSITYIWNDYNKPAGDFLYSELTWNINVKMKLHNRFWLGVQAAPIYAWIRDMDQITTENYHLFGLITQFDIVSKKKFQLYVDGIFNRSNLLILEEYNTKQAGIYYLGFGAGTNFLLNNKGRQNLFLEIGFNNSFILNKIEKKSFYTQYIFGVNYRFGKK
ncbi:hypothetical protein DNU06_11695 [Putridiphycobacter roseus]|uniref:Outer membrane protein beta-barrel domain-containing protein n=1 Tax=Putridiphycobacter roseus TaxID=2219161 RepID=A0A2W1NB46_9FLAO|nr:hypothetical protein DNU06_11695 [Putridiphycobacter roseus]